MLSKTRLVAAATTLLLAALPALAASAPAEAALPTRAVAAGDPGVRLSTFKFRDVVMNRERFDGSFYFAELRGRDQGRLRTWGRLAGHSLQPGDGEPEDQRPSGGGAVQLHRLQLHQRRKDRDRRARPQRPGAWPLDRGPGLARHHRQRRGPLGDARQHRHVLRPSAEPRLDRRSSLRPGGDPHRSAQVRDARTWKAKSARRAVVERKVGASWKLVRTVRVNAAGKAKLRLRSPQRFTYRVKVKQTATTAGSSATTRGRV